jgi:hypothetical protein
MKKVLSTQFELKQLLQVCQFKSFSEHPPKEIYWTLDLQL